MEDIQLIVSRADLEKQYKFLKRFSVNNRLKRHRPFFFILVVLFLVDVWLFSFTGASAFITAKGFLYFISLITLVLTGVYGIIIASENARSNQAIAEEMEGFVANKWNVVIRFDNDKVVYTTQEYKSEILWQNFTHYLKSDSAIWLYSGRLIPNCPPLSIQALGEENFRKLELIVGEKLQRVRY